MELIRVSCFQYWGCRAKGSGMGSKVRVRAVWLRTLRGLGFKELGLGVYPLSCFGFIRASFLALGRGSRRFEGHLRV